MFDALIFDEGGAEVDLGAVKIGFVGQKTIEKTYENIENVFEELPEGFFSVGQDVDYYHKLYSSVSEKFRKTFLANIKDVVYDELNHQNASGEEVFQVSLLRSIGVSTITGQYRRILEGGASLSNFDFGFRREETTDIAGIELIFKVDAGSLPSTNIHILIGRNGVGKTSLLNEMITALINPCSTSSHFYQNDLFNQQKIDPTYFSSLVSVAFSAFDPFDPPPERTNPEEGPRYYYVGLKHVTGKDGAKLKSTGALRDECVASLSECFSDKTKMGRWRSAITTLESDENFAGMQLGGLADLSEPQLKPTATHLVGKMSSGHAIVFLTISRLVAKIEEKTLVLLDEPESHLHPPLLSAFTRALSELLRHRNGVAIVATHSPVVLQEVPKSCVSIITRSRLAMHTEPPRIETFGENVGILTREVFGLEVAKSGFHSLLEAEVLEGKPYDLIVFKYKEQIGLEARGILRAMIAERDAKIVQ